MKHLFVLLWLRSRHHLPNLKTSWQDWSKPSPNGRCLALGLPWFTMVYHLWKSTGTIIPNRKPIWLHLLKEKTFLKSRHLQHSRPITSNETGTLYLLYFLNFVDIQPSWKSLVTWDRHPASEVEPIDNVSQRKKTKPLLLTLFHPVDFEICNPPMHQATARPIRGTGVPRCAPLVAQTHADLHPGAM